VSSLRVPPGVVPGPLASEASVLPHSHLLPYDHVLYASRDKNADNLKAYLADHVHANNFKRFVEHNPNTNFSSKPWCRIKTELPQLYREIKTVKNGSGLIKFLPDNKQDLVR